MPPRGGENPIADTIASRPPVKVDEDHARLSFTLPEGEKLDTDLSTSSEDDGYISPTEEENRTLRKVAANLPLVTFSLCLVEFAERASYYGASTVFSNFVEFPLPAGGNGAGAPPTGTQETAGALNMGLQASSGFVLLFIFLAYVVPIFGGWWADVHVGRYKAIVVGVIICGVAHIIQIIGAIPSVLQKGTSNAAPPFIIGLLLLAIGAGIFKPNIAPTILDQNAHQKPWVKTLTSGEKVIVDPEATAQRTMLLFYGAVNIGAFFMIATTYTEKYIGYWLAFLEPGILYFLLPILLAALYKRTRKSPPSGSSELSQAFKIFGYAIKKSNFRVWKKGFWEAVKPSVLAEQGVTVTWTDRNVEDVRRTVAACEVFFYFPIWNLNDGGIGSAATNQGASMTTNGAPNDLLGNFNPLTIIITIPLLAYVIYPALRRWKMEPGRVTRITFGFALAAISGMFGALVQWKVYETSPCGYYASTCDGVSPLNIWWQVPNVSFGAISECFCNVTAYELAYARAPPSMRSVVMAIFLFNTALSSALGEILLPVTQDPYLIWIWAGPAIVLAAQTILFWFRFKHLNDEDYMLSQVPGHTDVENATGGEVAAEIEAAADQEAAPAETEKEIKT